MGSRQNGEILVNQELTKYERFIEYIMHRFRWVFVVPILLPLGVLYHWAFEIRNYVVYMVNSAPKAHDRKVAIIQKQVRDWNTNGRQTKMCTARSGWMTMSFRFPLYKSEMTQIRTDTLVDILEVNTDELYIRVEPMVTMGQITRFLIPLGYTLPIVPELDDLTVGGMINGCGVEASGRKYGMFQHICQSFELVLADGSLVNAEKLAKGQPKSETANDLHSLFFGIPWSHGTIGFLTSATIRIIKCKPFVKLEYHPTNSLQEMCEKLKEASETHENEFVEGLLFTKDKGCVMTGRFASDDSKIAINPIGRWYKEWFYKHVEGIANSNETVVERVPLRDYYHRHSKSIFWELKEIVPFGNNVIFRWLAGWMCPPKISLLKATTTSTLRKLYDRQHVLQDMLVPMKELSRTVHVFEEEVKIYPLWLCPFYLKNCPGMMKLRRGSGEMYVDVGAYGITTKPGYHAAATTRRLEEYIRSVNGFQMLYADTYMTRAEFWTMFDSNIYEWLRNKYNCINAFPNVYDKVCRAARY